MRAQAADVPYDENRALQEQAFGVGGALTEIETLAVRQFLIRRKQASLRSGKGQPTKASVQESREWAEQFYKRETISDNRELDAVMAGGEGSFHQRVCSRLLEEEKTGKRVINRCPKCMKVVRTALAKQCLWCGADWH